jgi:UDP-N-acetylglucosamine 2-epimerase (non-hydrolysing)
MVTFEALLERVTPDVIVVVGDVNSTLACAIVGAKAGPYVAHVESGLRSRDWSMPEEVNRVATDRISDFLLAPSPDAVDNLRSEGYADERVHLVGNVMVDTLLSNLERARTRPILDEIGVKAGEYGLVTLHRPANVDDPEVLHRLMTALERVAERCPLVFPIHPRTRAQLADGYRSASIHLVEPAGYLDFIALEASARIVLTDSGGIQEESTVLGVPCLTLRDNTERPITIDEGTNTLVGRDPERIIEVALDRIERGAPRRCPELWDGRAGERIADVLIAGVRDGVARPTN